MAFERFDMVLFRSESGLHFPTTHFPLLGVHVNPPGTVHRFIQKNDGKWLMRQSVVGNMALTHKHIHIVALDSCFWHGPDTRHWFWPSDGTVPFRRGHARRSLQTRHHTVDMRVDRPHVPPLDGTPDDHYREYFLVTWYDDGMIVNYDGCSVIPMSISVTFECKWGWKTCDRGGTCQGTLKGRSRN